MRGRCGIAVAAVAALSLTGVAGAAAPPRLTGTFKVRIKITQVSHVLGQKVGATGVVKWRFSPKCPTGGCATVLKRHTLDGHVVTEHLSVSGSDYREKLVFKQDCFNTSTGKLVAHNAYTLTFKLSVHPTTVVGGAVTAFTSVGKTTTKVTAQGRARGCRPASETWTARSVG